MQIELYNRTLPVVLTLQIKNPIIPVHIKNIMAFIICTVTNEKKKKEALYSKDLNEVIIARPLKLNAISKIFKKKQSFNE